MIMNTCASRAFAEESHSVRITAEGSNILLHPSHGLLLIFQPKISRAHQILGAQEAQRFESDMKSLYVITHETQLIIKNRFLS